MIPITATAQEPNFREIAYEAGDIMTSVQTDPRTVATDLIRVANVVPEYVSTAKVAEVDELISKSSLRDSEALDRARSQYSREHYARTTELIPPELVQSLRAEARKLADVNTRRIDVQVKATGNTPRRLGSIPRSVIVEHSEWFTALYNSAEFRALLSEVVRNPVLDATYEDEKITGTHQNRPGDTHGWHWGDHEYAWIFIAEAPPVEHGGTLQSVPHTRWNKDDPQVDLKLTEGVIRSYYHSAGESYIFKTDTSLHRTVPITAEGAERIIINLTFASFRDWLEEKTYETTDVVYTE